MSLRIFHVVFIVASVALSLCGAVWGFRQYFIAANISALMIGLLFVVCGVTLVFYASKVFRKLRELP